MAFARRQQLVLELVLVAIVAYLAATGVNGALRLVADDLPPAPPASADSREPAAPRPLADYAVVAARDVFNPAAGGAERHRTLRLWGVGLDGHEARAVIEDTATHRQELYRVGDAIGTARVVAIDWDRVTLSRAGVEDVLELAPPETAPSAEGAPPAAVQASTDAPIRRTGENAWVVDRRELVGAADGMSGLMTQLRAVAEVHDGRPAGFRLFQIKDDSLFARLGLHDGDVVQRINGAAVAEPAALLSFLQRLRTEPRVAVDIVRGATPRTLVYDLR